MRILTLTKETQQNILENLLKRSPNSYGEYEGRVNAIIEEVRANRDAAVFSYTKKFDGADIDAGNILVTEEEIREAYEKVDPKLLSVIRKALVNIRDYHSRQRQNSWFDSAGIRHYLRTEGDSACESRRVCAGRQGRLPVVGAHECHSGKSGGCGADHYDDTAGSRRESLSVHTRGGKGGGRGRHL